MKFKFSANLETIRKSKKISQEELAELIGVSRQTIYKWEADICLPNLNKIEKIIRSIKYFYRKTVSIKFMYLYFKIV